MEPEGSLRHLQVPASCPSPKPDQSSPCSPSHFLKNCLIPGTKSHVPFQLLRSYRSIRPGLWHVYMFRDYASFFWHLAQDPSWSTTPCRLSATAYPHIHSYPPYWRPFLHPHPEDAPCRGDRDPYIMGLLNARSLFYVTSIVCHFLLILRSCWQTALCKGSALLFCIKSHNAMLMSTPPVSPLLNSAIIGFKVLTAGYVVGWIVYDVSNGNCVSFVRLK
jgi:hypothetical protein